MYALCEVWGRGVFVVLVFDKVERVILNMYSSRQSRFFSLY